MSSQHIAGVVIAVLFLVPAGIAQDVDLKTVEIARFIDRLNDHDAGRRYAAVIALGRYDLRSDVIQALQGVLDDPEDYVRVASIQNLRKMGDVSSVPRIIDRLRDRDYFVRVAAVGALRSLLGKKLGFDPDQSATERETKVVAWKTWWDANKGSYLAKHRLELEKVAGTPTIPAPATEREKSIRVIAATGAAIKKQIDRLETQLESKDAVVRFTAIIELGKVGSRRSVPALIPRLLDDDAFARIAAVRILRKLTSQHFGYDPDAAQDERERLAKTWTQWWEKQAKSGK